MNGLSEQFANASARSNASRIRAFLYPFFMILFDEASCMLLLKSTTHWACSGFTVDNFTSWGATPRLSCSDTRSAYQSWYLLDTKDFVGLFTVKSSGWKRLVWFSGTSFDKQWIQGVSLLHLLWAKLSGLPPDSWLSVHFLVFSPDSWFSVHFLVFPQIHDFPYISYVWKYGSPQIIHVHFFVGPMIWCMGYVKSLEEFKKSPFMDHGLLIYISRPCMGTQKVPVITRLSSMLEMGTSFRSMRCKSDIWCRS